MSATETNTASNCASSYDPSRAVVERAKRLRAMNRTWRQIMVITGKSETWLKAKIHGTNFMLTDRGDF